MAVTSISTEKINNITTAKTSAVSAPAANSAIQFPSANGCVRTKEEVKNAIIAIAKKYNMGKDDAITIVKSVCNQKGELLILSDEEYNTKIKQIEDAFRMSASKSNLKNTLKWFCNEPKDDNGFLNLLKASGCVSSDKKSLSDVSDSELKAAMEKLIKSPEMEKAFINFGGMTKTQKQEAIHKQVSYLEKLLANVSSNEKRRIYMIFSEITKESGAVTEGFRALIESFKSNKEELNKFLNEFTPSELAFIGVNQEDIALVAHLQTAQFESVDDARALQERIKTIAQNFRAEHKDELAAIEAKKNAQASGQQVEYTEKEQEILAILAKIEKSPLSGYLLGIGNSKIDEKEKNVLTSEALVYAEENGIKEDVLKGINTLYTLVKEEHPEYLSDDFDVKNFNSRLDELTDGEYTQICEAAETAKLEENASKEDAPIGFNNAASQPKIAEFQNRIKEKRDKIAKTEEKDGKPELVKEGKDNRIFATAESALNNGVGYSGLKSFGLLAVAGLYNKMKDSFDKKRFAKDVRDDNDKVDIVNKGGNSLAIAVNDFTEEEMKKLNCISGIVKNSMITKNEEVV